MELAGLIFHKSSLRLSLDEAELFESTDDDLEYLLLSISADTHYLYVLNKCDQTAQVLGVFDLVAQAEWYLHRYRLNPLFIPALTVGAKEVAELVTVNDGKLVYQDFQGVYRVGFKSYQVVLDPLVAGHYHIQFIDRYKVTDLGSFGEKEVCLALYNHFFSRLSGCGMCS